MLDHDVPIAHLFGAKPCRLSSRCQRFTRDFAIADHSRDGAKPKNWARIGRDSALRGFSVRGPRVPRQPGIQDTTPGALQRVFWKIFLCLVLLLLTYGAGIAADWLQSERFEILFWAGVRAKLLAATPNYPTSGNTKDAF